MIDNCEKIIDSIKSSWVKCEIVMLFRENPYITENLSGMSSLLAIAEELIGPESEELVAIHVLRTYGKAPGSIYGYTRSKDIRDCIDKNWREIERAGSQLRKLQQDEVWERTT